MSDSSPFLVRRRSISLPVVTFGVIGLLMIVTLVQTQLIARDSPTPSDDSASTLSVAVDPAVLAAEAERIRVVAEISRPTLAIFEGSGQGGGSGVLISKDGYALTNFHVVQPCGEFMRCGMSDGSLHDAVIVGIDPTGDVALIKLLGGIEYPVATLGDSDNVEPGDACLVAGNPFLLATDFRPTISSGIISGTHRYQYPSGTLLEYADCLQTDAAINPGNSGGPLFNARGELIGINGRCSFEKRGRVNVGVGYAISINQIKKFLGDLKSGRLVDHATLGATAATDDSGRVIVSNILESCDAYRRGLRIDDEIVAIQGRPIRTVNALKNAIAIQPSGWRIPLTFRRDGRETTIQVRLEPLHSTEELLEMSRNAPPEPPERPAPEGPPPTPLPAPVIPVADSSSSPSAEVRKWFVSREGFVNYYFNRLNRDRVWAGWERQGSLLGRRDAWVLKGTTRHGDPFELSLGEMEAIYLVPTGQYRVDLARDLDAQLEPAGSGGMLLALSLWRRMAVLGPDAFGDVYYSGTIPEPDGTTSWDVLVATHNVVETRFVCDSGEGREGDKGGLLRMECWPLKDEDPCELIFQYGNKPPLPGFPRRIRIEHGEGYLEELTIESVTIPPTTPEARP